MSDQQQQQPAPDDDLGLAGRLDAVLAKRAKDVCVLLVDQRAYDDQGGFGVDIHDPEGVLFDTRTVFFPTYAEADAFAREVAVLLILDIERVI